MEPGQSSEMAAGLDARAKLGAQVQLLDPMVDWMKKCMEGAQKTEAGIHTKTGYFPDLRNQCAS